MTSQRADCREPGAAQFFQVRWRAAAVKCTKIAGRLFRMELRRKWLNSEMRHECCSCARTLMPRDRPMSRTTLRDAGLHTAIAAAGGIGRLARLLGLAQPTVSCWKRVPPHRVIEIEALTGVSRRILRPDLFDVPEPGTAREMSTGR